MAAQLTLLGYTAKFADNGVEALKLWKTAEFQLLLTDIRMPEMDGYELIKAIRRIKPDGDTLPIIAVTANALKTDIEKCLETGADDVLPKPFGLEALKQMLEKWV
jgi:CheY-like chemotaxis protein